MNADSREKHWLGKLTKLKPAPGNGDCHGKAPHKPLLLLSLLDMAEAGEFPQSMFARSPGLVLRFLSYGVIVADRWPTRLDMRLPFFHLKTQEFLEPFDAEMRPAVTAETCTACRMNAELFELLASAEFRLKARIILITDYFAPDEKIALSESLGIQETDEAKEFASKVVDDARAAAKRKGRCARFSVRVCAEYRYTCALTGYRCVTGSGETIVDAAHIEGWAETQNDDFCNGLALSKNAHWMFDAGLWSADKDMRVIVNTHAFTEHGPESLRLSIYAGRHLQFDPAAKLRPALESLRRHRRQCGFLD